MTEPNPYEGLTRAQKRQMAFYLTEQEMLEHQQLTRTYNVLDQIRDQKFSSGNHVIYGCLAGLCMSICLPVGKKQLLALAPMALGFGSHWQNWGKSNDLYETAKSNFRTEFMHEHQDLRHKYELESPGVNFPLSELKEIYTLEDGY